jgi:transposase-like protein
MVKKEPTTQKRERVTKEQLSEIVKLRRQGYAISAIARSLGYHRQTISAHLKEKHEDIVAEEARKQVLAKALTSHFEQLARFAQVELKMMLDASKQEYPKKRRELRPIGPISTDGIMGLPYKGRPSYMTEEWARMYAPQPRESHLLASLREHTKESPVWVQWDSWRKIVGDYEKASSAIWNWLDKRLESKPPENMAAGELESTRDQYFGNILLVAGGHETIGPEFNREPIGEGEVAMPVAYSRKSASSRYMDKVIEEVKKRPEWESLVAAESKLRSKEGQSGLRRIARDMDRELVAIELMTALPGRCQICPA